MKITLKHKYANVFIEDIPSGKNKIHVTLLNNDLFMPINTCETSYPIELIDKILNVKGPNYLCDEILRDESPEYVQRYLKYALLSYLERQDFKNKRLLDFGCGSGSSTMVLGRMFPQTEIVAIELEEKLLSVSKARANHYGYENMEFMISPSTDKLPPNIGCFDYVVLSAVYEHFLPLERKILLPEIWRILKPGGILFLNQTPNRYFPVEFHTTSGLPFINYLPDEVAHYYAQHFSKRKLKSSSWEELLRSGIRGGSIKEIFNILNSCSQKPILLNPYGFGNIDRIDIWDIETDIRFTILKKLFLFSAKFLRFLTGITMIPRLDIAIKKSEI